eukprot:2698227-Ditylum_brightwellii.AAC.1
MDACAPVIPETLTEFPIKAQRNSTTVEEVVMDCENDSVDSEQQQSVACSSSFQQHEMEDDNINEALANDEKFRQKYVNM